MKYGYLCGECEYKKDHGYGEPIDQKLLGDNFDEACDACGDNYASYKYEV